MGVLTKHFTSMIEVIKLNTADIRSQKAEVEVLYAEARKNNERTLQLQSELQDRNREIEKVNKALIDSYVQLKKSAKLSSLEEISAGIAHEVNQPLSVISLYAQTIEDLASVHGDEELNTISKKIQRQIERITKIINHLRLFSRMSF